MIPHRQSVNYYTESNIIEPVGSLYTQWPAKKGFSSGLSITSAISPLIHHVETNVGGERADCEGQVYCTKTLLCGIYTYNRYDMLFWRMLSGGY